MKYRVIVYEWIEREGLKPQYMPMYDQAIENVNIKKIIEVVRASIVTNVFFFFINTSRKGTNI